MTATCTSIEALTGGQLRELGQAELARLGEEGLRAHLVDTAMRAHSMFAPVLGENLLRLLDDRNLVRYPVRIAYELGSMAPHQFGQPEPEDGGVVLYLHPQLEPVPLDAAFAVAYFLPLINYGQLINDDHCLLYGATLHGLMLDQYFSELCRIADSIGVPERPRSDLARPACSSFSTN